MISQLDASNFFPAKTVKYKEFEIILTKITKCYHMMIEDGVVIPNDENGIRDILVNDYVNNCEIKRKLELRYFVLPEVEETGTSGRTDIRIFNPNTYYDQAEYYIIECKRLDEKARTGTSGLNSKYIKKGIQRFISEHYSSYYQTNAMIGFMVKSIDIDENIENINQLLITNHTKCNTLRKITKEHFISDFEYQYSSKHKTASGSDLKLYHLMFDFNNLID